MPKKKIDIDAETLMSNNNSSTDDTSLTEQSNHESKQQDVNSPDSDVLRNAKQKINMFSGKRRRGRTLSIYFHDDLFEIIDKMATENDISFSKTVNILLESILLSDDD